MSVLKKVIAKVISPDSSPTATSHNMPMTNGGPSTPTSTTRSSSLSAEDRRSSVDGNSTRGSGRKQTRISTLLNHIRSRSETRDTAPEMNGVEHDETIHSHEIVRPSTQRSLSMTEEKIKRKQRRDIEDDHEAEERRQKHLETWKNVRPFLKFCQFKCSHLTSASAGPMS